MSCDDTILTVKTATAKSLRLPVGSALDLSLPVTGLSLTGKVARFQMSARAVEFSAASSVGGSGVTISGNTITLAIQPDEDFLAVQSGVATWSLEVANTLTGPTIIQITGKIHWV